MLKIKALREAPVWKAIAPLRQRAYYDLNPVGKGHWSNQLFLQHRDPAKRLPLENPDDYKWMFLNPIENAGKMKWKEIVNANCARARFSAVTVPVMPDGS